VFSEDTSYKMRALLRLVVTKGTGRKADAPGYRIGGKTGTAREDHQRPLYQSATVVTSFAGVFPMDEPRYVIVDDARRAQGDQGHLWLHTAGWNVAPVRVEDGQPDRADARRPPRQEARAEHGRGASLHPRKSGRIIECDWAILPASDRDSGDSEVTGFALDHRQVAPGNVFGAFAGRASTARISSPRR
jgi:hypothetical protein